MLLSTQQRSPHHPPSSSPLTQLATQPSSTVLPACSHLSPTQQPSLNYLAAQLLSSTLLPPSSPILSHPAAQSSCPNTQRNSFPPSSAALSHLVVHIFAPTTFILRAPTTIYIVEFRVLFIFMIRIHYYSSKMV